MSYALHKTHTGIYILMYVMSKKWEKKTVECYRLHHLDYTVVADTGTQPLFWQEELHKLLSQYIDFQTVLGMVVCYSFYRIAWNADAI